MLRAWKNKKGFKFKGILIDTLSHNFFNEKGEYKNVDFDSYLELIKSVFEYLKNEDPEKSYWLALGSNQQISNDDNGKFVKKAEKAYNKLINVKEADKDINDIGGQFEEIRNRYPDIKRTKEYNDWIENHGFVCENRFETYFKFKDKEQAKKVFTNIWGEKIGSKVNNDIIKQNIIIYKF